VESHTDRHVQALLAPQSPEERTLSTLLSELTVLADRYKGDKVMLVPLTMIASGAMRLAGDGQTGRIDPSLYNKQVRDTLARAGVDVGEL
jgi:hypothetical protein